MSPLRMPAEWEPHDALWLALHHDEEEWGPAFAEARESVRSLTETLAGIAENERIELLVPPASSVDAPKGQRHHPALYGDIWLRDTGPIFVHRGQDLEAASFEWSGWGGKYLFEPPRSAYSQTPHQPHSLPWGLRPEQHPSCRRHTRPARAKISHAANR